MTQRKKRITITLPPDLIVAADRRAKQLDRSRSWVVAEARRAQLAPHEGASPSSPAGAVAEPPPAVLIERTLPNARRVLDAVSRLGFGFANEWLPKEILARPVTVIGDDPQIDIFTVAWRMEYEQAAKRSSVVGVEGVAIPLIRIDDLIETRRTGRPLDAADLEALEEIKRLRG